MGVRAPIEGIGCAFLPRCAGASRRILGENRSGMRYAPLLE